MAGREGTSTRPLGGRTRRSAAAASPGSIVLSEFAHHLLGILCAISVVIILFLQVSILFQAVKGFELLDDKFTSLNVLLYLQGVTFVQILFKSSVATITEVAVTQRVISTVVQQLEERAKLERAKGRTMRTVL